jgi:hypothetical protein
MQKPLFATYVSVNLRIYIGSDYGLFPVAITPWTIPSYKTYMGMVVVCLEDVYGYGCFMFRGRIWVWLFYVCILCWAHSSDKAPTALHNKGWIGTPGMAQG